MRKITSRRLFLYKSALATTGLAFLSSNVVNAFTHKSPYEGYNPYADAKTDLRAKIFGEHVRVKGTVYDETGLLPLPDALVEVWHLSPNSLKFKHRTKLQADSLGQYDLITDFPGREPTKGMRIYFKVTNSNTTRFTELALDKSGANITSKHWEENRQLGKKLLPKAKKTLNTLTIDFNISI